MKREPFVLTYYKKHKIAFVLTFIVTFIFICLGFLNPGLWILAGFSGLIALISLSFSIEKKPVIIIDYNGIFISNKNKLLKWHSILSFKTAFDGGTDGVYGSVIIEITTEREIYKTTSPPTDQSLNDMRNAIIIFSEGYTIKDNGHKNL
jgi:hypothetical protein